MRRRRTEPGGGFQEHGDSPPPPPPSRPDRPSPYERLDAIALIAPPRPDHVPEAIEERVRRYVRRPVRQNMLLLFGILLVGVVLGLLSTIGQSRENIRQGLFTGNTGVSFTIAGIFLHNALVALIPVLLFPLLFWGPAGSLGVTGFAVGQLAGLWQAVHFPNGALIVALIPHGVIEIPSFLLAGTMAWRLGSASWDFRNFGGSWWLRVRTALRTALPFVAAAIGALAVAAVIEVKVTPALVHSLYPQL